MRIASFVRPYALGLLALLCACGSHRDGKSDERDEDAGAAGRAGAGGRGGAGSGAAGSGPAPVACGRAQCPAPVGLLSAFPTGVPAPVACCVDASKGTCGSAAMAGAACEPVAIADTRCPGIDLGALAMLGGGAAQGGTMMMSGCCIENACGLDGALLGRGCVENGQAASMLSGIPLIGTLIAVPAPRACDAPAEMQLDAGAEDAG
jgi:hypothetical protein